MIKRALLAIAAVVVSLTLISALMAAGGRFVINYLIHSEAFVPNEPRVWVKVGVMSTLLILALVIVNMALFSIRKASWWWFAAVVLLLPLVFGREIDRAVASYIRVLANGTGWTSSELTGFTVAIVILGTFFGMAVNGLSEPERASGATSGGVHLHFYPQDPAGSFSELPYLQWQWLLRRAIEGLSFGAAASIFTLWSRPEGSVEHVVMVIWTCLAGFTLLGVALGVVLRGLGLKGSGVVHRVMLELILALLICTYPTVWFWVVIIFWLPFVLHLGRAISLAQYPVRKPTPSEAPARK